MFLILALWLAVWLALTALWVMSIVGLARTPVDVFRRARRNKDVTVLLVVLTGWIGALYFFIVLRPELGRHAQTVRP
jgi:hypothetical protein